MGYWPGVCTAAAIVLLLVLIIRYQVHAFIALLVVSLGLGLAAGMAPQQVVDSISKGVGDILRDVAVILALGAVLGRLLEISGAAEVIARTLVNAFGVERAPLAILLAGFLVGIPVLFNVGFLVLLPIVYSLQKQSGKSLLFYLLPLSFSLGLTHSLVPPHPGIVGAVNVLGGPTPEAVNQAMVQTILFGSLMSLPLMLIGWYGPGRFWARRQFVPSPDGVAASPSATPDQAKQRPSFFVGVTIVTLPLVLSLVGFGVKILSDLKRLPDWVREPIVAPADLEPWLAWLGHTPLEWLQFFGKPVVALFVPTLVALWMLGVRRGLRGGKLAKVAEDALRDVGSMVFLFGAAGGFKEVIVASRAGDIIADSMRSLPLSPVAIGFLVAALMRIALGSATASILTASGLLARFAASMPGQETLLILAVANGVTVMTQPADSGFWMLKEFGNLSVRDVMFRFNACRIIMSLCGLCILLVWEALA